MSTMKKRILAALCALLTAYAATAQNTDNITIDFNVATTQNPTDITLDLNPDSVKALRLSGSVQSVSLRTDDRKPLTLVKSTDGKLLRRVSLDTLDAERIESFSILKSDAARSYDIYGDTSGGVIVIELKKEKPATTLAEADFKAITAMTHDSHSPLIILKRDNLTAVIPSLKQVASDMIKSISVIKNSDAARLYDRFGDTSSGVIVAELKKGVDLPAGARIVNDKTLSPEAAPAADPLPVVINDRDRTKTADPLLIIVDDRGRAKAVERLGSGELDDIESITLLAPRQARDYASLGDISHGVKIVKFKTGKIPARFRDM